MDNADKKTIEAVSPYVKVMKDAPHIKRLPEESHRSREAFDALQKPKPGTEGDVQPQVDMA